MKSSVGPIGIRFTADGEGVCASFSRPTAAAATRALFLRSFAATGNLRAGVALSALMRYNGAMRKQFINNRYWIMLFVGHGRFVFAGKF